MFGICDLVLDLLGSSRRPSVSHAPAALDAETAAIIDLYFNLPSSDAALIERLLWWEGVDPAVLPAAASPASARHLPAA